MFWWFERNGEYIRCEVLTLPAGGYELRIVDGDGKEVVEHFHDPEELRQRQQAVRDALALAGWTGPHGGVL